MLTLIKIVLIALISGFVLLLILGNPDRIVKIIGRRVDVSQTKLSATKQCPTTYGFCGVRLTNIGDTPVRLITVVYNNKPESKNCVAQTARVLTAGESLYLEPAECGPTVRIDVQTDHGTFTFRLQE